MDLVGKKFNKLTVLSLVDKKQIYFNGIKNGYTYKWLCQCDCGNQTVVQQCHLLSGHTQSCGCHQKEAVSKQNKLSTSRLYEVWRAMIKRCYYEKSISYKNYGKLGITVCDEWRNSFLSFYKWAMENGYNEKAPKTKCTLDRIDVNGNYCPENCRWVNNIEQQRNKRNNRLITINGITKCLVEWCDEFGIKNYRVYGYCQNNNASLEEGLYVLTHKRWNKSKQQWVDK